MGVLCTPLGLPAALLGVLLRLAVYPVAADCGGTCRPATMEQYDLHSMPHDLTAATELNRMKSQHFHYETMNLTVQQQRGAHSPYHPPGRLAEGGSSGARAGYPGGAAVCRLFPTAG